jgi:hypothetical protein
LPRRIAALAREVASRNGDVRRPERRERGLVSSDLLVRDRGDLGLLEVGPDAAERRAGLEDPPAGGRDLFGGRSAAPETGLDFQLDREVRDDAGRRCRLQERAQGGPPPDATATRSRTASGAASGGIGYRTSSDPARPASRRTIASSSVATHRAATPADSSARATGTIPWP